MPLARAHHTPHLVALHRLAGTRVPHPHATRAFPLPIPASVLAYFRTAALWFFRDCAFYITMNTTETKHTNTKGTRL